MAPYRAFTATSPWNTKLPADVPIDVDSAKFLADAKAHNGSDHMQFAMGNFAQPFYFAKDTDPLQTVADTKGRSVTIHIPKGAAPMVGNDAEFTVFDQGLDVCAGFHWAYIDAAGKVKFQPGGGLDKWRLSSNGLHKTLAQSDAKDFNDGHRGSPAPNRGIRLDEVRDGLIAHAVSTFWFATHGSGYFPMSGFESGKGGIVPEGMRLRIKPTVDVNAKVSNPAARVIAKSWQDYGIYVGDNSGSTSRVKLERGKTEWAAMGINVDSMSAFKWDDWVFVARGWGK